MRRPLDPPQKSKRLPMTPPTLLLAIKIKILRLTPQNVAQKCTAMGYPERKTLTQIFFSILADFDKFRPKIAYFYKNAI